MTVFNLISGVEIKYTAIALIKDYCETGLRIYELPENIMEYIKREVRSYRIETIGHESKLVMKLNLTADERFQNRGNAVDDEYISIAIFF